jgi:hypothetical protein
MASAHLTGKVRLAGHAASLREASSSANSGEMRRVPCQLRCTSGANGMGAMPNNDESTKWSWSTFWAVILAAFLLGVSIRLMTSSGVLRWDSVHLPVYRLVTSARSFFGELVGNPHLGG